MPGHRGGFLTARQAGGGTAEPGRVGTRIPRYSGHGQRPRLRGRALDARADDHGVQLYFIDPGKRTQNAYTEVSMTASGMRACQHWFTNIGEGHRSKTGGSTTTQNARTAA